MADPRSSLLSLLHCAELTFTQVSFILSLQSADEAGAVVYSQGKWSPERLSHLPVAPQLISGEAGLWNLGCPCHLNCVCMIHSEVAFTHRGLCLEVERYVISGEINWHWPQWQSDTWTKHEWRRTLQRWFSPGLLKCNQPNHSWRESDSRSRVKMGLPASPSRLDVPNIECVKICSTPLIMIKKTNWNKIQVSPNLISKDWREQ
jgi:hypothetical protein